MDNTFVKEKLTAKFGDALTNWEEPYGMLTFTALAELNLKVMQFLYDDEELKFQFLTDLQAVHYPLQKGEELAVVYHLHNLNLRYNSYPFDWAKMNIKKLNNVLENDFYNYTNSYKVFLKISNLSILDLILSKGFLGKSCSIKKYSIPAFFALLKVALKS